MESKNIFKRCSGLLFLITVVCPCDPAEEGKPHELIYTMSKIPSDTTMVMWTKDDIIVAECPLFPGDCVINDLSWLTAKVEKKGDTLEFSIYINSVSRGLLSNAKGIWMLRRHTSDTKVEVFYYCNLQVYAKPAETNCKKTLSKDGLTVSCYGKQVYPEAMITVFRTSVDSNSDTCKNTPMTYDPVYYETICERRFNTSELHLEMEDFTFCVYPSVIGTKDYNLIGTNVSMSLLIEPSSISVRDCNRTTSSISCSCERLDTDDSKSGFNWYANDVEVKQKSQYYTAATSPGAVDDIICKPITTETTRQYHDVDNSAVIVLVILLVAAILGILVLVFIYTPLCKLFKDKMNFPMKRTDGKKEEPAESGESKSLLTTDKEGTSSNTEKNEATLSSTSEIKVDEVSNEQGSSDITKHDVKSDKPRFDFSVYNVKTSILLLGTKDCNKELFKRSLLQEPYCITSEKVKAFVKDSTKWKIMDCKTKQIIFDTSGEKVKLPDNVKLQVHYSKREDAVFKLVDGPVYDQKEVKKFIEEMKSCLVLCREGYNAVVVVYTTDKEKEISPLTKILHETFAFNMNNIILIKSNNVNYKEYEYMNNDPRENTMKDKSIEIKQTKMDNEFKTSFGERFIQFYPLVTYNDNNDFFSLVCQMGKVNAEPVFAENAETLARDNNLETVSKELSLLMEIISNKPGDIESKIGKGDIKYMLNTERECNKTQTEDTEKRDNDDRETKLREIQERLQILAKTWDDYLHYNVDSSADSGVQNETFYEGAIEQTTLQSEDQSKNPTLKVFEDVKYLIQCFQKVYFVA
ncbi:uncharacterized protein LOC131939358 isoform X2 [Physella acuta]|uniref:uncharacterized protein LOC131939358 isoform X2 n=1 Tax=Physella acuta TaxID=109671 RepID=UPI0027DB7D1A|nr:uncharacterized protein LOC131939358 isoform X2 [Physella acuta]